MTTPSVESKNQLLHSPDGQVDLLTVDCSSIGGSVYHICNTLYAGGALVSYGGQTYDYVPYTLTGFETKAGQSDLPRPTLTISMVNGILLAPVTSLGDIVNAVVTYTVVYASYLDAGANPDTSQYAARGVWKVCSKVVETNQQIQFELASALDVPGLMYPPRQYLIYPGVVPPDGIYFPGIQPYRVSGS